jgi:hypothetical protein
MCMKYVHEICACIRFPVKGKNEEILTLMILHME